MFLNRIKLTLILAIISVTAFSQKRDSTLHTYFKVKQEATLNVDFQHTELSITTAENDTIAIHTNIKVIPQNYKVPFAGIIVKNKQSDSSYVSSSIAITEDIQPNNEFEAHCQISIPRGTQLKLKNRYGIITINAPTSKLNAIVTFTNLTIDTLASGYVSNIAAHYSSIKLNNFDNKIILEGTNNNLTANHIKSLETASEFSEFNIKNINILKTQSYTDKFIIENTDSMTINSNKSSCKINHLNSFFQGEMNKGKLSINKIGTGFNTINIANTDVKNQLCFDANCHFLLNADMRYCQLIQDKLTLKQSTSPGSTLLRGKYGEPNKKPANLSIISTNGDVSILFHEE